jgi:hypothetical protein
VSDTLPGTPPRLGLVELLDPHGGVAARVPVTHWPVTIGRALDCDVLLDDPHAAARHATIRADGDAFVLEVGDTRNGLLLRGRQWPTGSRVPLTSGAEWRIGRSTLRLRLPDEALAAELPLAPGRHGAQRHAITFGLIALLLALLGEHWLQSDPGDPLGGYLPVLVGVPIALGVWCFLWALGSKMFARHFDFLPHLRLALPVLLASMLLDALLPLAAFATGWTALFRIKDLLMLALAIGLLYGHLSLILPARRQALAVGFATMFVVGAGLHLALNQQRNERWFAPLYLSSLGPPGLRLAPAATPEAFIDEARRLRAPLEQRARETGSSDWLAPDEGED